MVSIIVPVYNAEKSLGYCVSSILNQTYRDIEVILVNDGSTDGSLKICNNYKEIDARIKVIDIPNGGVGNARNVGIQFSEGEYIQFADADDSVDPVMVERMVNIVETYKVDIAMCGFEKITLDDKYLPVEKVSFSSEVLGKECIMLQENFKKRLPTILWKTSLLECSWNKIYKANIIKENNIQFPTEISLGEDFVMNIKYFSVCKSLALISDKLYYYMQLNEQALTRIYRQDFFENQMLLIDELRAFLEDIKITPKEQVHLSEYIVSKVIQSLENYFHSNCNLRVHEIKYKISTIINNQRVRNAFAEIEYINPKYEWLNNSWEFSDIETIYNRTKRIVVDEGVKDDKIDIMEECSLEYNPDYIHEKNPGYINRFCVCILNVILKVVKIRQFELIRNTLIDYGIKATFVKSRNYIMRKKCKR